jgi:hypothetical protein
MKITTFLPPEADEIIIISALIDGKIELNLGVDTAATHTTIDSNVLHLLGYEFASRTNRVEVETSNGIIFTDVYRLDKLTVFGETERSFEVQVYDFLAHGITSNYDGVVGLDFLRKRPFCLDIANGVLTVQD